MKGLWPILGSVCLISTASVATAQTPSVPTFNQDIAPILYANCVTCHRPGEIAPMSLLWYKDARPWARAIKSKVLAGEMPPWGADAQYGKFRNAPHLMKSHIDTLVAWVDAGAPEGTGTPPSIPVFPEGFNATMGRKPDFVAQMPIDFDIPASGEIPNFDIYSKVPFTEDKFIEAVELRPGNRRVTHHSSIRARPLPEGTKLGTGPAWVGGPLVEGVVPIREEGKASEKAAPSPFDDEGQNVLLIWVPGGGFQRFRPGVARRITPDDYFQWRLHYTATGKPETDRHTLGLWYSQGPVTHEVISTSTMDVRFANGNEVVAETGKRVSVPNIPAFAGNWMMMGIKIFQQDVTLNSVWPHMHLRGKNMRYVVTYPDGREETILNVPNYAFEWQFQYEFEEPLRLPAGTVMRVISQYDNSAKNRRNPAPDKDVLWGEQSWEEMFNPFMDYWVDQKVLTPTKAPTETR